MNWEVSIMQSKTSYFSRTLFLNQLKRFWPLYASYLIIWLLIIPVPLNAALSWGEVSGSIDRLSVIHQLLSSGLYGGVIMSFIFSALFAMAAFHHFYNSRSTSMICALPVKREGVFISLLLPGLLVMLLSNLLVILISLAITASYGVAVAGYAMQALAMMCLMSLFFCGFASLCAMLTGHILVLPAVYVVLSYTVIVVAAIISGILNKFVYGFDIDSSFDAVLSFASPVFHIMFVTGIEALFDPVTLLSSDVLNALVTTGYAYNGWVYLIIIAAVGVLMMLGAMLLMKRRRMEAAGDVVAIKPLKPVFKYCLTVGCALVSGLGLYYLIFSYRSPGSAHDIYYILGFMLLGAFIGYFAAEMMIQKTFRVFSASKWRGLGIVVLVLILLTVACETDLFGYERRMPEHSEIESVTLTGLNGMLLELEEEEDIQFALDVHKDIIDNKKLYESSEDQIGSSLYLYYDMKNGSRISRSYLLCYDVAGDLLKSIQDFANEPDLILQRKLPPIDITEQSISDMYVRFFSVEDEVYKDLGATSEDAYELYSECILPDMQDGTIGLAWLGDFDSKEHNDLFLSCDLYYTIMARTVSGEYMYYEFYVKPTALSERTNAWLEEHGVELHTLSEVSEALVYYAYDYSGENVGRTSATDMIG